MHVLVMGNPLIMHIIITNLCVECGDGCDSQVLHTLIISSLAFSGITSGKEDTLN